MLNITAVQSEDAAVLEGSSRATRRHHLSRVKHNRSGYWGRANEGMQLTDRLLGIVAGTPKICACWKCSKPRKHTLGVHEVRQQQPKLHELDASPYPFDDAS